MTHWFRREIITSPAERVAGRLSAAQHREAALLLHTRGYVVLRDAVPPAPMRTAQVAFAEILRDCVASQQGDDWYQVSQQHQAVFWQRGDRWRIFPKLRGAFADAAVVANPLAMGLITELLGNNCFCKFVSSDTCIRGSDLQSPHRELGCGGQTQPLAYIVNVPLVHCGLHNGPLEIWPCGTHLWHNDVVSHLQFNTDVQDGRNAEMESFAADLPSIKVELRPGDVLIRDPGLLHRGTPNPTDEPRSMLTICFFRHGHTWDYGRADYNVDEPIFRQLPHDVRRYFDYAFTPQPIIALPEVRGSVWQRMAAAIQRKSA
jgi:ectoine hydroxylase-related dioxygenase (phytanoyl-CoA dioxygenase family)